MSTIEAGRPTRARINLENLAFNLHSIKGYIENKIEYMAIVKADAYGHGAVECARKLQELGIDWFGVAIPEEALELRRAGITKPILSIGSFWENQENLLLENRITPVIYRIEQARRLNRAAGEKNIKADVHIKIDTGMGRIGVRHDEVNVFVEDLKKLSNLNVEGIMSHFAAADDLSENDFTDLQMGRFDEAVTLFAEHGFRPRYKDLANSPGAIAHRSSRKNLVRLGGVLYGLGDDVLPKEIAKPELKAVLSLQTRIAHLKKVPKDETLGYGRTYLTKKDSIIATIPVGYHDGFPRSLSNRGKVIINGKYAPIVGRISMDWTIINVTNIADVKVNDEVILIGSQNDCEITAEQLAILSDTISYEITCGISRRVPRIYVGSQKKPVV